VHVSQILDYLNRFADRLSELGGAFTKGPIIEIDWQETVGSLASEITSHDRSRLDFAIVTSGPNNFPEWLDYHFHYMDPEDRCIFRYDNAPYHATGVYFPHHKHVGPDETVVDHPVPTLAGILDELRGHLYPE